MITPPEWLEEEDPSALKIWEKMIKRLEKRGLLESCDPEMLGAYCFCMARALACADEDPSGIDWVRKPAFDSYKHPRWVGYPHSPGENPLVHLWQRGAEYAGNLLGLWPPRHISFAELLLYDGWEEIDPDSGIKFMRQGSVIYHLKKEWQFGEDR